jgi:hypothetical protein
VTTEEGRRTTVWLRILFKVFAVRSFAPPNASRKLITCFGIVSYSLLTTYHSLASPADSTKPQKPTTLNDTWFTNAEPENHHVIDTSIFHIEQYNPIQREGIEYTNAGNLGSAAFPLVFSVDKRTGFNLGYNQFDLYRYQKDSIKYYQVVRPYADLLMMIGIKNEQMYRGKFANQHKGIIYYGVEFTRMFSKGIYPNQRANDNGFYLYGIFNSKNKHWNVQADLVFNSFKVQENGGVTTDIFDSTLFQKTLAPTRLSQAENNYRQTDFYLKSSYNLGKKYSQRINDSTTVKTLMPVFKISYQFNVESSKYKFRDLDPDPDYYGSFFLPDSVFNDLNYLKLGNAVMLDYHWRKLTSDSTYMDKNFVAYGEAGYEHFLLSQNKLKNNFGNLYVAGTVRSNPVSPSKIIYRATVKYFPYGWNQNDFFGDALAGYDFEKWGLFTGSFTYQMKEVPYIYKYYTGHPLSWNYQLPKSKTLAIGARYQNIKWGIFADANYYLASNIPVFPGSDMPFYLNGQQQNFTVIHAGQRNGFVGIHLENEIWVTLPNGKGTMTDYYPFIYTKHSLFYEHRLFKNALWFSIGFDARLRYQNNPPYYEPLLAAFYPTNSNFRFVPQLDFFLNLKVRTVRVFLKVDNIISAIEQKGYYPLYYYPAADISFKVGIMWRFFE